MDRWLERLGYATQWLSDSLRDSLQRAGEQVAHLTDGAGEPDEGEDDLPAGLSPALLAGTAATWAASYLLRPQEVRWSRAVLAGVLGTLLYDAAMAADQRVLGRKFDTIGPLGEALTDDPELQPWAGWAAHYASGIGLALFYARYLHHRLPGSPATRGALFGLLDATTLQWGGLLPLLHRVAPHVELPRGYSALAHSPTLTAQSLLRHLAYGVAVGLVYRPEPRHAWKR